MNTIQFHVDVTVPIDYAFRFFANPHHWTTLKECYPASYRLVLEQPQRYPKRPEWKTRYQLRHNRKRLSCLYDVRTLSLVENEHLTTAHDPRAVESTQIDQKGQYNDYHEQILREFRRIAGTWQYEFKTLGKHSTTVSVTQTYALGFFDYLLYGPFLKWAEWQYRRKAPLVKDKIERLYLQRVSF